MNEKIFGDSAVQTPHLVKQNQSPSKIINISLSNFTININQNNYNNVNPDPRIIEVRRKNEISIIENFYWPLSLKK